jgi:hypothetical protein
MRAYVVSFHLSVRQDGDETIHHVICECPAIVRIGSRLCRIVKKHVRKESARDPCCFFLPIPTSVFQRVREDRHEAGVIGWLTGEIITLTFPGKKHRLRR